MILLVHTIQCLAEFTLAKILFVFILHCWGKLSNLFLNSKMSIRYISPIINFQNQLKFTAYLLFRIHNRIKMKIKVFKGICPKKANHSTQKDRWLTIVS